MWEHGHESTGPTVSDSTGVRARSSLDGLSIVKPVMPDLNALFRLGAIVLVGASPDHTIVRRRIVEAVTLHGFDGPLQAVS